MNPLSKTTKAEDINWQGNELDEARIEERVFRERGEQRYSLEVLPIGITLDVDRLRRQSSELVGELSVSLSGKSFKNAKVYNGVISVGDLNFSSVQARHTRAKLLAERSRAEHLDWFGLLEEFCIRTVAAERAGKPSIVLADLPDEQEKADVWDLGGFKLLRELPTVVFGDASSGKSYFAMYLAGLLAQEVADLGQSVIYADWEFSAGEHRKRLSRLFQPMPRNLHYVRCDTALVHQSDRLARLARELKAVYIVCDSIGFAVEGPAESQEGATKYFRTLRQLNIGSLNIGHIPKQYDDSREAQLFGSIFFKAGARSAWFVDKASTNPRGEFRFGLHHRKSNVGELQAPLGYRITFDHNRTRLEQIDVKSVDELAAQLPMIDRVKLALKDGAMTQKQLSDDLAIPIASIRSVLARHKGAFIRVGPSKYGLLVEGMDF